jgi:para-nitrobenzyl esterase
MRWRSIVAVATTALLLQVGVVSAAPAPRQVAVTGGAVEGDAAIGVLSFKGIPFAAPPVGPLRWRAPQPVAAWSGVRPALRYGADCLQSPFPGDAAPLGVSSAEDCLYLNVWRPAEAARGKLPVMVWIYGGGFVNGGSSPSIYDGSAFARKGVVLVSFNYRLGRFGFFAHPALTKEAAGAPIGNYGYMDQIAALKWVKANIAAFGGDPDNVTLFGESAGGGSVLALMTSPLAQGLFQKVIVESGGGRGGLMPLRRIGQDLPGLPSAESIGVAFARSVGVEGTDAAALQALRGVPGDQVVQGLNMGTMNSPTYVGGPLLDGQVVVEAPDEAVRGGRYAKVPMMIGANSNEIGFSAEPDKPALFKTFGANAARAQQLYDPDGKWEFRSLAVVVGSDRLMVEPARYMARLMAERGHPTYAYRFSYVAESKRGEWAGAPHATEIPYVFDTARAAYGDKLTPADTATAEAANSYWVSFAKTGAPGSAKGVTWPRYEPKADVLLDFTNAGPKAVADPWRERLDLVAAAR